MQANLDKGGLSTKSKNTVSGRNLDKDTGERTVSSKQQHMENLYVPSANLLGPAKLDTYDTYNSASKRVKASQFKYNQRKILQNQIALSPYKQSQQSKELKGVKGSKNTQFIQRTYGYRGSQVQTQSTEEPPSHNTSVDHVQN